MRLLLRDRENFVCQMNLWSIWMLLESLLMWHHSAVRVLILATFSLEG